MTERDDLSARTVSINLGTDDGDAFTVTSGAAEKLAVDSDGNISIADAANIDVGTTTGTKIGTATTQKLGFYNATPVVQRTVVADPTGGATQDAEARTAIIAVITRLEQLGLFASA
jgi:hypothetical protein